VAADLVERPLPKPSEESYVETRLLEAVTEARLALRFLKEGLTRNAAGKAFQAWKALLAALLRLELDKLKAIVKTDEEKRWLETTAVLRAPTTKMRTLTNMLEELGHSDLTGTLLALELHDYQYHGPDPDMANSKYTTREEATTDIIRLTTEVAKHVEALRGRIKWDEELEKAIKKLKQALST
jgi:hypothetical protein